MRVSAFGLLGAAGLLAGCERTELDLSLAVTPPGSELRQVVLKIDAVQLRDSAGVTERLDVDLAAVDLLRLGSGRTLALVDNRELEPGRYDEVRLLLDESESYVVREDGSRVALDLVNDRYSRLDLTLEENERARRLLDLELRFSLADREAESDRYAFDPLLRTLDPDRVGQVSGAVPAAVVEGSECRDGRALAEGLAVYVFSGLAATPGDRRSGGGPLLSARVQMASTSAYQYRLPLLAPGDYTLALTCRADEDDPLEAGETLDFDLVTDFSLEAGETLVVDLEP